MKRQFLFIAGLLACLAAFGEDIRVSVPASVVVSSSKIQGESVQIRYNEAVGIQLAPNDSFLQAIEIEIKIPKELLPYVSTVGWSLYEKVTPAFLKTRYDYQGQQLFFQPLPERVSVVIQIPVDKNHTLKTSSFATVLPVIASPERFPLLFRFFPMGKGTGKVLEENYFSVTVRPVVKNEGALNITIAQTGIDPKDIGLTIDDAKFPYTDKYIFLKRGTYTVRVSVDGYREEVYTVSILPGEVVPIQVVLSSAVPLLVFSLPDTAVVLVDGKAIDWQKGDYEAEPGEHLLTIKIGDFVITRKLTILKGKKYSISLEINLVIETSP